MLADLIAKLAHSAGQGEKTEGSERPSPADLPATLGYLPKDYVMQSVNEIRPLLRECYSLALEKQPDLQGKIKVQFTIIADEEYGGLIEGARVLDSELAGNVLLNECFTQTMYALRMKAPSGGGRVVVTYPFSLAREKP